jgi:hypothetical protein
MGTPRVFGVASCTAVIRIPACKSRFRTVVNVYGLYGLHHSMARKAMTADRFLHTYLSAEFCATWDGMRLNLFPSAVLSYFLP